MICIKLQKDDLLKPLQIACGATAKKTPMQILTHCLIKIEQDKISVTGTNLEIELIGAKNYNTSQEATFTAAADKILEIFKSLEDDAIIELIISQNSVEIKSKKVAFSLNTLNPESFPIMKAPLNETELSSISITEGKLKSIMQRTYFAIGKDDARNHSNGLLLEICDNKLIAIANDGHRLALNSVELNTKENVNACVVIPIKSIHELIRLLSPTDEEVSIKIYKNHFVVSANDFSLKTKLLSTNYPNYKYAIPINCNREFKIEADALKYALIRTSIMCQDKHKSVRFTISTDILTITTRSQDNEIAIEKIDIIYTGRKMSIDLNLTYIIDMINVLYKKQIQIKFKNPGVGLLIEEDAQGVCGTFVIMPMAI